MNALAALRSAWRALTTNLLRSVLTMLGIIIGVAAVITMVAVGSGAQQRVEEQIKSLGSNIMLVLPGAQAMGGVRLGAQTGQTLTEEDAKAMEERLVRSHEASKAMTGGLVKQTVRRDGNDVRITMGFEIPGP